MGEIGMEIKELDDVVEENEEEILYHVPFYGQRGSINKIVENGNYYSVTRYDLYGNDGEVLITPKRYKNKLLGNYIDDVRKYLEANNTKYMVNIDNQLRKDIDKKKLAIGAIISVCISALSISGVVFTTKTISNVCLGTFFFSFIASCYELNLLRECLQEEKRQKFINEYKCYVNELNEFNLNNERSKESPHTVYSNIKNQEVGKVMDIANKKVLKKESF